MKPCLSAYNFQREADKIIAKIYELNTQLEAYQKRLFALQMQGECDTCGNRLKCLTDGEEMEKNNG